MKNFGMLGFLVFSLISCTMLPAYKVSSESWNRETFSYKNKGSVIIHSILVYTASGRDSVQNEITGLAPLIFMKHGFPKVCNNGKADYISDICVFERQYMSQWRTLYSIALEVRIWPVKDLLPSTASELNLIAADISPAVLETVLPLAASRVVITGNKSLSSSFVLNNMLTKAIVKSVKQLNAGKHGKNEK